MMKVIDNNPATILRRSPRWVAEAPVMTEAPKTRYEQLENRIRLFSLLSAF
jgi:hypothetical protein